MESLKINTDLYLISTVSEKPAATSDTSQINHIWLYDRSGSMYNTLPELCMHMKVLVRHLPKQDTLTLMWFSGQGQHWTILKKYPLTTTDDLVSIDSAIDSNNITVGLTCFSETLTELVPIIKDLSKNSNRCIVTLFTDGYPVVNNLKTELDNINTALDAMKNASVSMLLIGYGDHYNRELMLDMANRVNGSCLHNNDLKEWGMSITRFIDSNSKPKRCVIPKIPMSDMRKVFTVVNTGVVTLYNKSDKFYITSDVLYILSQNQYGNVTELNENMLRGCLGASLILSQNAQTDISLDIMGKLGDKYLIDLLSNSYTNEEYGRAEQAIMNAITEPANRFKTGRDITYLPDPNAFCVFEVLSMLMEDPESYFYPKHKAFEYKRIGRPHPQKEGYSPFVADEVAVSFSSLTWHDTRLNLSVLAKIPGKVQLLPRENVTPDSLGFIADFPTFVWRNYAFVKDGVINVKQVPVKLGVNSYVYLSKLGVISNPNTQDGVYILDLSTLPIINRRMSHNKTSATALADLYIMKLYLNAHIKVLKDRLKMEVDPPKTQSEIREKFLLDNGIKNNGSFSPPTVPLGKPTDYYIAKSFAIKVSGMSALPKVSAVTDKINANKRLTLVEQIMEEMLEVSESDVSDMLEKKTKEVRTIKTTIQENKFAVILAKKWFDEFTSRTDNSFKHKTQIGKFDINSTVKFIISEDRVAIN